MLLFLLTALYSFQAIAQPYSISFSGAGLSTVKVQNLTTGDIVDVPAGDVLLLSTTTGIPEVNKKSSRMKIYPNPMTDKLDGKVTGGQLRRAMKLWDMAVACIMVTTLRTGQIWVRSMAFLFVASEIRVCRERTERRAHALSTVSVKNLKLMNAELNKLHRWVRMSIKGDLHKSLQAAD